jgi:hypothetical protein
MLLASLIIISPRGRDGQSSGERGERVFVALAQRTPGWRSSGRESVLSPSQTPTASTITKCVWRALSSGFISIDLKNWFEYTVERKRFLRNEI